MTGFKKFLLSLLIAVVLFGGFAVWAYSGLFATLETTLFRQKIEDDIGSSLKKSGVYIDDYISKLQTTIRSAAIMTPLSSVFRVNQNSADIEARDKAVQSLRSQFDIDTIRIIGRDLSIQYSTRLSDIRAQSQTKVEYQPSDAVASGIALSALALKEGDSGDSVWNAQDATLFLTFPVLDSFGVFYGTAIFEFGPRDIENGLQKTIPPSYVGRLLIANTGNLLINYQDQGTSLANAIDKAKPDTSSHRILFESKDTGRIYAYFADTPDKKVRLYMTVGASELEFSLSMKIVLLVVVFLTVFLLAFLLLNLKHEPITLLNDRIKRLQINILQEYLSRKDSLEGNRWQTELRGRRDEVRDTIKRGLGRSYRRDSRIDDLIDKGWDEILDVVGSRQTRQISANFDISRLEELVQKVIANYQQQQGPALAPPPRTTTTAKKLTPKVQALAQSLKANTVNEAQADAGAEELESLEEMEAVDVVDADEDLEEIEAEEVEEGEDLEEIEAEEVEEGEDLEEVEAEPVGDAENLEEIEAEPLGDEKLEEVEAEQLESLEEIDAVEEAPLAAAEDDVQSAELLSEGDALDQELVAVEDDESLMSLESVDDDDEDTDLDAELASYEEGEELDEAMPVINDPSMIPVNESNLSEFLPFYDENIPGIASLDLEADSEEMFSIEGLPAQAVASMEEAETDLADSEAVTLDGYSPETGALEEIEEFEEVDTAGTDGPKAAAVSTLPKPIPIEQLDPAGAIEILSLSETGAPSYMALSGFFKSEDGRAGSIEAPRKLEELMVATRNSVEIRFLEDESAEGNEASWDFDVSEGVVKIPEQAFGSNPRPRADSTLGELIADLETESVPRLEPLASIAGLFKFDQGLDDLQFEKASAIQATPTSSGQVSVGQEARSFYRDPVSGRKELSFGSDGVDYDSFAAGFRKDESGQIKSLYTFSKRFQAETSLLVRIEADGLKVLRYLGLPFELPEEIHFQNDGEALLELRSVSAIVLFKRPEALQRLFDVPCIDPRLVKRLVMFPLKYDGKPSYCLLGYSRDIALQGFIDSYIETLPKVAVAV